MLGKVSWIQSDFIHAYASEKYILSFILWYSYARPIREAFKKQAYMAYKSRLNITAEVYWFKLSYHNHGLFYSLFMERLFTRLGN